LDAAHVLPVAHKDSTDATCNGVALCSLHHRAYDLGLVYFDSKFNIIVNKIAVQRLEEAKRTGGLVGFRKNLQPSLLLPDNTVDRPAKVFVEKANTLRRVK
jgi:putative restriction endonuclease